MSNCKELDVEGGPMVFVEKSNFFSSVFFGEIKSEKSFFQKFSEKVVF